VDQTPQVCPTGTCDRGPGVPLTKLGQFPVDPEGSAQDFVIGTL